MNWTSLFTQHISTWVFVGLFFLIWAFKYLSVLNGILKNQRLTKQELCPGSPDALPGLDVAKLQDATEQLEKLGFEFLENHLSRSIHSNETTEPAFQAPIADPNSTTTNRPLPRFKPHGFARVMVHNTYGCLGKILCVSVVDKTGQRPVSSSLSVVINSYCGLGDDDWCYTTTNRASPRTANALMKITRHHHRLSTRMPGSTVEELLKTHLTRRAEIAEAAGLTWNRTVTLADDYRSEERASKHIRRVYTELSPLSMAWKLFRFKRLEHEMEWLGELKGRLTPSR